MEKGISLKHQMEYMPHRTKFGKLAVSAMETDAIGALQHFTDAIRFKHFLGICNIFRQFSNRFADITTPLNSKWDKYQP